MERSHVLSIEINTLFQSRFGLFKQRQILNSTRRKNLQKKTAMIFYTVASCLVTLH